MNPQCSCPQRVSSGHVDARIAQQPGQRDQRQPDQGTRVVTVDRLEQADAKAFALEAAGAVEWLFAVDVPLDLRWLEYSELHSRVVDVGLASAVACVEQAQRSMKMHDAARAGGELGTGALAGAGLVQDQTIDIGHLVGSDHQGIVVSARCGPRCRSS